MTGVSDRDVTAGWKPSRRVALHIFGGSAMGLMLAGCKAPEVSPPPLLASSLATSSTPGPDVRKSYSEWRSAIGDHYYVAHRGSGDVLPEHTLEAYQAAVAWGAQVMEVSVVITEDRVLACMHDLTYDRTTTAAGRVRSQSSVVLRSARVDIPRLGPAWQGRQMPRIPLLEDVLTRFGGRVLLCLEAKDDHAYAPMIDMIRRLDLGRSVMIKVPGTSRQLTKAKSDGFPVFAYLAGDDVVTAAAIDSLAEKLDPALDVMVIQGFTNVGLLDDRLTERAVETGVPVWVFPVHRRYEAEHFFRLGAQGIVTSSFGYVSGRIPRVAHDAWREGAIVSGEMTKDPASERFALQWRDEGQLVLGIRGGQHFFVPGQLCPLNAGGPEYKVEVDVAFDKLPSDPTGAVEIAFGHADDSYYENGLGQQNGYHAYLRADGRLGLAAHSMGSKQPQSLATEVMTQRLIAGAWARLRLSVNSETISISRVDGPSPVSVSVQDKRWRGGYLHLGRATVDGVVSLRGLHVDD